MKCTIDRALFAEEVAWVAGAADSTHSTHPIMAGMMLKVEEEGGVYLSAYDYETSAQTRVPAVVAEPGICLVSAAMLERVMKAADGDEVQVTCDDSTATITCGGDAWHLILMAACDYPRLPEVEGVSGSVSADELICAFKQVGPVVAKSKGAEIGHTGVYFDAAGQTLALVATDRIRLAATEIAWHSPGGGEYAAVVPSRLLADFLPAAGGEVGVGFVSGQGGRVSMVALTCRDRVSTVRVIEAPFPAWRSYFARVEEAVKTGRESGTAAVVEVKTDRLAQALKKAAAVIDDRPNAPATVRMAVGPEGLHLTGGDVAATFAAFDSCVEAVVVGSKFPMKFNLNFLTGALTHLKCDLTSISIYGKVAPVLLRPASDGPTHRQLIQPLRET